MQLFKSIIDLIGLFVTRGENSLVARHLTGFAKELILALPFVQVEHSGALPIPEAADLHGFLQYRGPA